MKVLQIVKLNVLKMSLVVTAIAVFPCYSVHAQSIYSAAGMGEQRYFTSIRSAGMGGAGLTGIDPIAQNQLNPASWPAIQNVSYGIGLRSEGLRFEQPSQTNTSRKTAMNSLSLTVSTTSKLTFGGGFRTIADSDFRIESITSSYKRTIDASGGLSLGYFGFGYNIGEKIYIGVTYNYLFGTDEENWELEFEDLRFANSKSIFQRNKNGSGFTAGVILPFSPRFRIGAVYMSESNLETERNFSNSAGNFEIFKGKDIHIPQSFGVGISSDLSRIVTFAGEIYRWQYSELDLGETSPQNYNNSTRYSAGFEFGSREQENVGLFKRLQYRIGGYYWELYNTDVDGSALSEKFFTAGLGIPFNGYRTRIDIGIEAGIRSSKSEVLGTEEIVRVYIGLAGGEKWFVRRTRS